MRQTEHFNGTNICGSRPRHCTDIHTVSKLVQHMFSTQKLHSNRNETTVNYAHLTFHIITNTLRLDTNVVKAFESALRLLKGANYSR
jgi:hypothetical protein